jgi:hypothetical protein
VSVATPALGPIAAVEHDSLGSRLPDLEPGSGARVLKGLARLDHAAIIRLA